MKPVLRASLVALCCALLAACATPPPKTVRLPPPATPGEPFYLTGLSATKIRHAFGIPAFVRKDGRDEMWRYDGAHCKAFFFLYPDGGTLKVRHVETIPRGKLIAADEMCLDALLIRAAPQPVS